jgi:hypothetical protein
MKKYLIYELEDIFHHRFANILNKYEFDSKIMIFNETVVYF